MTEDKLINLNDKNEVNEFFNQIFNQFTEKELLDTLLNELNTEFNSDYKEQINNWFSICIDENKIEDNTFCLGQAITGITKIQKSLNPTRDEINTYIKDFRIDILDGIKKTFNSFESDKMKNEYFLSLFKSKKIDIKNIKEFSKTTDEKVFFLLRKLKLVSFYNCYFENDNLDMLQDAIVHFDFCIFGSNVNILNYKTYKNKSLFFDCEFKNKVILNNKVFNNELFQNCRINNLQATSCKFEKQIFNDVLKENHGIRYNKIKIIECQFNDFFCLPNVKGIKINKLEIVNSTFERSFYCQLAENTDSIFIGMSTFNSDAIISSKNLKKLVIQQSNFNANTSFENMKVNIINLKDSIFNNNCNFFKIEISNHNSFQNTTFNGSVNFSKAKFESINFQILIF